MGPEHGDADDLEDGFQIQKFSESEEDVDAVVQDLTKKRKRKRKSEKAKSVKVG